MKLQISSKRSNRCARKGLNQATVYRLLPNNWAKGLEKLANYIALNLTLTCGKVIIIVVGITKLKWTHSILGTEDKLNKEIWNIKFIDILKIPHIVYALYVCLHKKTENIKS